MSIIKKWIEEVVFCIEDNMGWGSPKQYDIFKSCLGNMGDHPTKETAWELIQEIKRNK